MSALRCRKTHANCHMLKVHARCGMSGNKCYITLSIVIYCILWNTTFWRRGYQQTNSGDRMAAVSLNDVPSIINFDCTETANMGPRWRRWLRSFEIYAGGKGIRNNDQKKALLLHVGGIQVQYIFFTLPDGEGDNVYAQTVDALTKYFSPEVNIPYERHVFRSMCQGPNETVEQFITRLRSKAETCEFGNAEAQMEQIRDQVIEKCLSHHLRRKLLEKGRGLTLQQVREIARSIEMSEMQATEIEQTVPVVKPEHKQAVVNKVTFKPKKPQKSKKTPIVKCYSCGKEGHKSKDKNCRALGQECNYCKGANHFERCCRKKLRDSNTGRLVRSVDAPETMHAFIINSVDSNSNGVKVNIQIGGILSNVLIDSGASCNVTDRNQWEFLKKAGITCSSKKEDKLLYAYGSSTPLPVAGTFKTMVRFQNKEVDAEFIVIEGKGQTLLGHDTATKLNLLHVGPISSVNSVESASVNDFKSYIFKKYPECFSGVGKLKNYQLKIPINESVKPVAQPIRRIPFGVRDALEKKLIELEKLDIIEKTDGPSSWISPVVILPKKKDIRLCIDMRVANQAVVRERFVIPTIDEVLQDMNKSSVFSKIDIKWAYHQIELHPESRDITTFITHKGLFRYKRLIFGVSCASELYQKVLSSILQDCEGVQNIMDDIVVYGENEKEHDERLHRVICKLRDCGFTLNPDKCQFRMNKIVFMGHVLSEKGIGPAEVKVQAIQDAEEPKNASEVKSFLGLVNFSARFIPNLATINEPLRNLTKKNVPFSWGEKEKESFEKLKRCLSSTQCLGYFDTNALTQIVTDASPVGIAAVLIQKQSDGFRVISYASRALTEVEQRYSQTEKEALGIVWGCERFHMYVYGLKFQILTDHKPLECIYSVRSKPSARIERWVLRLQPYDYTVKYVPGDQNIADPLSRLLSKVKRAESTSLSSNSEDYVHFIAREATPVALTTKQIELESEKDIEMIEIRQRLLDGQWFKCAFKEYLPLKNELCCIGMLVLRGSRIVVPRSLRQQILELAHEGHPGIVSMKQRIRTKVWWPNIDKSIEKFCNSCQGCQLVSEQSRPEPMHYTELPSSPWQHVGIDLLDPLPSGETLLVLSDYYSRWLEIIILKSTSSESVTKALFRIFSIHGFPESVQTDNGPQFISEHFRNFARENGIKQFHSTPLWPQANGQVERQNRSILKRIRIAHSQKKDWRDDLNTFLMMYRSTPHTVTGVSPSKLLFGREIRTKIPSLDTYNSSVLDLIARDRDSEQKEKGKVYCDKKRNAQECNLQEGDKVLMRQNKENKLSTRYEHEPYTVIDKLGNSVVVQSQQGINYKRNVTHLKKFANQSNFSSERSSELSGQETSSLDPFQSNLNDSWTESINSEVERPSRPVRLKKPPVRFKDYVLTK